MKYTCTRDSGVSVSASQAILAGISPDGGLFLPESYPRFSSENISAMAKQGYPERAAMVMGAFEDDLSGKNYVIYTDNSRNATGNYNIYAASYDPDQADEPILIHAVETEEEWQRIEFMLQKLSRGPEAY